MKKIISIVLAIMFLALHAVFLSSCNNEPDDDTAVPKIEIPIAEYTVIRPWDAPEEVILSAVNLRKNINSRLADASLDIKDDWVKGGVITDEVKNAKEILIGSTTRPESSEALEGVSSSSFVIKIIGNKIVINAQKSSMIIAGVDYFINNLVDMSGNALMIQENLSYISEPIPTVDFIKNSEQEIKIVYSEALDNTTSSTNENDRMDLDVVYAKDIRSRILKITDIKLDLAIDWFNPQSDIASVKEILVGNTAREETSAFLNEIKYSEYGFKVIGNKIVVAGWNETTTELAVNKFLEYFESNLYKNDDGTYNFSMFENEKLVLDSKSWFDDYPQFEGGNRVGSQDAGYGNLQVMYKDAEFDEYNAYCKKLEAAGFELYMENTIVDNVHKAYISDAGMLYVYYVPTEKSVRIISCPDEQYNLPEYTTPESVPAYEKITDSSITQMTLSYTAKNFGLCHIITLEDGSFIVYDGGGNMNQDYVLLYNTLNSLNKRTDGKIVIAAWILTHEHWDHYTNFATFCKNYSNKIVLEGLYCNTPSGSYAYNGYNPNYYMTQDFDNLSATLGGVPKYIVHTGMKFYIRNACIEVIYTQEDLYPKKLYNFNDCSMVSRVTVAGQTITYLGDVRYEGSKIMCNRYKQALACDIVQVSHHGYDGGTTTLYGYLAPKTCLWPSPKKDYDVMSSGDTSKDYLDVDNYIVNVLKVPVNICAEPTATIMLPFKPGDTVKYWN